MPNDVVLPVDTTAPNRSALVVTVLASVAVAALPVKSPVTLPVTSPVTAPTKVGAVTIPVKVGLAIGAFSRSSSSRAP